ncbi:hypothetical protein ACN38_g12935, partial [Penicillium nordicum]
GINTLPKRGFDPGPLLRSPRRLVYAEWPDSTAAPSEHRNKASHWDADDARIPLRYIAPPAGLHIPAPPKAKLPTNFLLLEDRYPKSSPTVLPSLTSKSPRPPSPRLTKPTLRNMVFSTVMGSGVALSRGAPRRLASGEALTYENILSQALAVSV